MRGCGKNASRWCAALGALGLTLSVGCAADPVSDDQDALSEGTYAVTGFDLGTCATDAWQPSTTKTSALVVETSDDGYAVKSCSEQNGVLTCAASSPSRFVWSGDAWRGSDGGAYLTETGCLLVYVDATARLVEGKLVLEATRWSSTLAGGSCTYDEVMAMRENPCDERVRLLASAP